MGHTEVDPIQWETPLKARRTDRAGDGHTQEDRTFNDRSELFAACLIQPGSERLAVGRHVQRHVMKGRLASKNHSSSTLHPREACAAAQAVQPDLCGQD